MARSAPEGICLRSLGRTSATGTLRGTRLVTDATDFLAILETAAALKLPQDINSEQEIRVRLIGAILFEKVVKDLGG